MERVYENVQELRLDLRVPAGRIAVETADTDRVDLRLEPLTDAAQEMMDAVTVDLRRHGAGHELLVEVPERRGFGWFLGRGAEFDLWVRCPAGSSLDARTASADVTVRGTVGEL